MTRRNLHRSRDVEDGLGGQSVDERADARVGAWIAQLAEPVAAQRLQPLGKRLGLVDAGADGRGEELGPVRGVVEAEGAQAAHVGVPAGGEHEADRRHDRRRDAAAAVDDVDQAAPDAPVAVGEGVDRLELGVGDRCLERRGEVVAVQECDEVGEQIVDFLRGRWDELRGAGSRRCPICSPSIRDEPTDSWRRSCRASASRPATCGAWRLSSWMARSAAAIVAAVPAVSGGSQSATKSGTKASIR